MTDSSSPFDDPEFRNMLEQSGVQHQPGMAADMMHELKPLMAADGYDLDNLGDVDVDELNAAMDRAVERHNMALATPVGNDRDRTINTLRELAEAVDRGQQAEVTKVLDEIRPDPTKHLPSAGHLNGVIMETLDAWYCDKKFRKALNRVSLRDIPRAVKKVAQEVQALARKSRAFGSMNTLLLGYGGKMAAEAGIYLVSVSVAAVAGARKEPFANVLDEMLPAENSSAGYVPGSAFGQEAARQLTSQGYMGQFSDWLEGQTGVRRGVLETFELLVDNVQSPVDLHDADDLTVWLDELVTFEDSEALVGIIDAVHQYVHFRMEIDQDPAIWYEAHDIIDEESTEAPDLPPAFKTALQLIERITPEQRYPAVLATPIVAGVLQLVEWIGKSRQITGTGLPRRADIETVAAMIGIDAKGVAKLPEDLPLPDMEFDLTQPAPPEPTRHVQSAKDITQLLSWWTALVELGVIEVSATKVYPAAMAEDFRDPATLEGEAAEVVLMAYVREYFLQQFTDPWQAAGASHTMQRIVDSMTPRADRAAQDETDDPFALQLIEGISIRHFRNLEVVGLMEIHNAEPHVPESLRPAMLFGIMMTLAQLREMDAPSW